MPTVCIYTGPKELLPTPRQQFYNSGFKYRPSRSWKNGKPHYKTNKASWAKQ